MTPDPIPTDAIRAKATKLTERYYWRCIGKAIADEEARRKKTPTLLPRRYRIDQDYTETVYYVTWVFGDKWCVEVGSGGREVLYLTKDFAWEPDDRVGASGVTARFDTSDEAFAFWKKYIESLKSIGVGQ
jgi:hypothetical protein